MLNKNEQKGQCQTKLKQQSQCQTKQNEQQGQCQTKLEQQGQCQTKQNEQNNSNKDMVMPWMSKLFVVCTKQVRVDRDNAGHDKRCPILWY